MHCNDVCSTQFAMFIRVTWWINRVEAHEEQVIELLQFIDDVFDSPLVMIAISELHTEWFQRF